jgi:hypothetical protein|tara:strand:+ start:1795 stop:2220 length:426 start_codon:yes stop_codon:yes gene_type:complete
MGRPLKKTKMAQSIVDVAADLVGKVAVTGYRPSGGSLVSSTTSYIISQRGSKLFKIWLEDSTTGVYELKAVAPASLANTSNQFCVQIILNDSTVAYVEKFYNNTVHYVTAAGATGTVTYTLGVEGDDEAKAGAGIGSINVR